MLSLNVDENVFAFSGVLKVVIVVEEEEAVEVIWSSYSLCVAGLHVVKLTLWFVLRLLWEG